MRVGFLIGVAASGLLVNAVFRDEIEQWRYDGTPGYREGEHFGRLLWAKRNCQRDIGSVVMGRIATAEHDHKAAFWVGFEAGHRDAEQGARETSPATACEALDNTYGRTGNHAKGWLLELVNI